MSAQVELTVLFVFWRLFLALAIADSFALARGACNNSAVARITPNFTFRCRAVHAGRKQRTKIAHWKTTRFPQKHENKHENDDETTRKRYCERGY
jgi:hypothetical protein